MSTPRSEVRSIAVFLPSLAGGGAERVLLTLAAGFAARGRATDLVLADARGPYLRDVPAPVRIVDLGAGRVIRSLPGLTRYLRRRRPQALLAGLGHANLVALWARTLARQTLRVVVSEHAMPSDTPAADVRRRTMRLLLGQLVPRFYPQADAIVAVSAGVADAFAARIGLDRRRIRVIYNPVVTPALLDQARAGLDHPWFTADVPPVVLSVGRLTGLKNYPLLIRAFARVVEQRPARLMILGEGEDRGALEALVRELGLTDKVALPGFVDNPFAYMAQAAVFVLSSWSEGLPTALIEALACGCPVVSTDCRSGPREILEGGRFGRLVPPGAVDELAAAIRSIIDAPPPPVPADVLERFRPERVVDQYLALLGDPDRV